MTLYAFDGTSNRLSGGPLRWTHVALMAAAVAGRRQTPGSDTLAVESDNVFYQRGVGSGNLLDKLIGGFAGWGAKYRVRKAYDHLCSVYAADEFDAERAHIDVVGFSRGSATALHFANVIYLLGLRRPRPRWRPNSWLPYRPLVGWIWFRDWTRYTEREIEELQRRVGNAGMHDSQLFCHADHVMPKTRFLGLFDAVSSFALPMDTRLVDLQSLGFGFRLSSPANVVRCAHAMALDERRTTFRNVRVVPQDQQRVRSLRSEQMSGLASAIAMGIGLIWIIWWIDDDELGWFYRPSLVIFVIAIGAMFGHMRGSADRSRFRSADDPYADDVNAITGDENTTSPGWSAVDVKRAIAVLLGVPYTAVAIAGLVWANALTIRGVSDWDMATLIVWAVYSGFGFLYLSPLLASDSRSVRSGLESAGIAAQKLGGGLVLASWVITSAWLISVATDRISQASLDPAFFRVQLGLVALASVCGVIAHQRPSRRPTSKFDVGAFSVLLAMLIGCAAAARPIAGWFVEINSIRWFEYLVPIVGGSLLHLLYQAWASRHSDAPAPKLAEIRRAFDAQGPREMWFRGAHTDIGGGGAPVLGDHALRWMIEEAMAAGLAIDLTAVETELDRRVRGRNPAGIGSVFDPLVARPRRVILDNDLGHASLEASTGPVSEVPADMARFNLERLLRGKELDYDPAPERSGFAAQVARRVHSPHPPRFIAMRSPTREVDSSLVGHWRLHTSVGLLTPEDQQALLDEQRTLDLTSSGESSALDGAVVVEELVDGDLGDRFADQLDG